MKFIALIALVGLVASASLDKVEIQTDELGIGPYILGGDDTTVLKHPYIVALFAASFQCGGSIISEYWVLTAAHCSPTRVQHSVSSHTGQGPTMVSVAQSIRHPNFISYQQNDIMLLRLATPITFSEYAQPIRFPPPFTRVPGSWDETFVALGWGYTRPGTALASVLQEVELKIVSNDECNEIHRGTGYQIYDSQICVGVRGGGKSECNGDSGSPGLWNGMQVGLSSWSIKPCANPTYPGVYTNTTNFVDFIEDTTGLTLAADGYFR